MTSLTPPRHVRRRKSYEERTGKIGRRARCAVKVFNSGLGREYTVDSQGRRVRVFTRDNWCTPENVREWLLGHRVVEIDEALEHVSRAVLRFLIDGDYLRKDRRAGFYWNTAKAARKYALPPVIGRTFLD